MKSTPSRVMVGGLSKPWARSSVLVRMESRFSLTASTRVWLLALDDDRVDGMVSD